jgi:branched-chain amino acid transport system ATP-binding protein
MEETPTLLSVNNIEAVYNRMALVLKDVSLKVPVGSIVALLGGNGAGKTTTLKAISNLIHSERGEVSKGSVEFRGERIDTLTANDVVQRGMVQIMEGRHCFEHLTVEENLLTGAYIRKDGRQAEAADLEKVYHYFPLLKQRRTILAGLTSGGEQQMTTIGRALMARPKMILLDEPSMGLSPQLVEEIFKIIDTLNTQEGVSILLAEQNTAVALRHVQYGYILENGYVVLEGSAEKLRENKNVKEFYLGLNSGGRKNYRNTKRYHRREQWS